MIALRPQPSTLRWVQEHAIDKYIERADKSLYNRRDAARDALLRMYRCAHVASDVELRWYHIRIAWYATYFISETSVGKFCMVIEGGWLKTILRLDE